MVGGVTNIDIGVSVRSGGAVLGGRVGLGVVLGCVVGVGVVSSIIGGVGVVGSIIGGVGVVRSSKRGVGKGVEGGERNGVEGGVGKEVEGGSKSGFLNYFVISFYILLWLFLDFHSFFFFKHSWTLI